MGSSIADKDSVCTTGFVTIAVHGVPNHIWSGLEGPTALSRQPVNHRNTDDPRQPLEAPRDKRAVGPWTCKRYVEVVPIALGYEQTRSSLAGSLPLETIQLRNMDGGRFRVPSERTASTPLRCHVPS